MSTVTTDQGIVIPVGGDPANNPSTFVSFVARVESGLVLRYTSNADRTARNPTPTTGQLSFVAGNTWYDRWTGSKWLPVTPLRARKAVNQTINNSTTLTNDVGLAITFPAVIGNWQFTGWLLYTSSTVADIKVAFAADAAITGYGFSPVGLATGAAGTTGDVITQGTTALGTAIAVGGSGGTSAITLSGRISTSGAAGTLQFQWAQNTLEVSNTVVLGGAWLQLEAID